MSRPAIATAAITAAAIAAAAVTTGCHSSGSHQTGTTVAPRGATHAATITGPVPGAPVEPLSATPVTLPPGYVEQEFFAAGTATAYTPRATPKDGRWSVTPATTAAYRTRLLVRRPTDPHRFSGTVVVEWMNVSSGESSPDWTYLNPALTDAGDAYVGVSVQALGVTGGTTLLGGNATGLVTQNPQRYRSLHHPGDRYAYDMFAQVGAAVRGSGARALLGGDVPRHVVAAGESQSAFFLTTFTNAIEPRTHTFDGIFIHSRGGGAAPVDAASAASGGTPAGQRIRTDLDVPVFMFETETDVTRLGYYSARQPDADRIRTWEVAGTAHADTTIVGGYESALGCTKPINDGPQHVVAQAAFEAFTQWVAGGAAPPSPSPLRYDATHGRLVRDATGNAIGGVRTPAVDVPVSALSGEPLPGGNATCVLFGSTTRYTPARLAAMYGDKTRYLARFRASLDAAVAARSIRAADRGKLLRQAQSVQFPS